MSMLTKYGASDQFLAEAALSDYPAAGDFVMLNQPAGDAGHAVIHHC